MRRDCSDPGNPDYLRDLGVALHDIGMALQMLGRHQEAAEALEEAVKYQLRASHAQPPAPSSRQYLGNHYGTLATSLGELGRLSEAEAAVRKRQASFPADPNQLMYLACDWAQLIPVVGKGKSQLTAEEQAQQRRYTEAALEALRQAVRAGLRDAKGLREDADLAPLRSNEDFQKLLAELEKKNAGQPGPH